MAQQEHLYKRLAAFLYGEGAAEQKENVMKVCICDDLPHVITALEKGAHSDSEVLEIEKLVMGHSLIHSLVHLHCSLVRLFRTARLARTALTRSRARGTVEYYVSWIIVQYANVLCLTAPSYRKSIMCETDHV